MDPQINLDFLPLRRRLAEATTPDQVVEVIRGLLLAVPSQSLETLPGGCAELIVHDVPSLYRWAWVTRDEAVRVNAPPHALISRLATMLGEAANRVTALAWRPPS